MSFLFFVQRTWRLHRPQESRTRWSLTGEPGQPKPAHYWLRSGSHGHLGRGEKARCSAHPCNTGNRHVHCGWPDYQQAAYKLTGYSVTCCDHSNWRACVGRRMEATSWAPTAMEATAGGRWVRRTWARKRNQTFLMVMTKICSLLIFTQCFSRDSWSLGFIIIIDDHWVLLQDISLVKPFLK